MNGLIVSTLSILRENFESNSANYFVPTDFISEMDRFDCSFVADNFGFGRVFSILEARVTLEHNRSRHGSCEQINQLAKTAHLFIVFLYFFLQIPKFEIC